MKDETRFHSNISTEHNATLSVEANERITDVLNTLVEINNDRIEGYGHAADETDESDLKGLFYAMAAKSRVLNSQLTTEVRKYGGKPTESTTTLGKVFRAWMDFKAALTGKDAYADAIKNGSELPPDIIKLIIEQKAQLRQDHNHVKALRDRD